MVKSAASRRLLTEDRDIPYGRAELALRETRKVAIVAGRRTPYIYVSIAQEAVWRRADALDFFFYFVACF